MEHNREPRNKHTFLWSIFDKGGKAVQWVKIISLINGVGKIGQIQEKYEIRPSYTIHKNKLKII